MKSGDNILMMINNPDWVSSNSAQRYIITDDPNYTAPDVVVTTAATDSADVIYDAPANENLLWGKIEERPWGTYQVLYEDATCKVKKIVVNPFCAPSYQYHRYRKELWQIISGEGIATINDVNVPCATGDYVYVRLLEKHRIRNIGSEPLIFIEIQTGELCIETDIVRISDDYNRV